jgi:autotransporter-associated beta strand protein
MCGASSLRACRALVGFFAGLGCAVIVALAPLVAQAANGTWINTTSGGLWSVTSNWSGGIVADGNLFTANFSTLDITADNTVRLDTTRTIAGLNFGDTTPSNNWILDNNGNVNNRLTLSVGIGGFTPLLSVSNQTVTISAVVSGAQGFSKDGAGTLVLSGNNTLTGGVTIINGMLQLGNVGALNSTTPSAVTFDAASTGTLSLNGNSVTISGLSTNASPGSPVVQNASPSAATLTVNNAGSNTYAGVLQDGSGGGALSLFKSGAGTLTLSGANTFTGNLAVNAGALQLNGGSLAANVVNQAAFIYNSGTFNGRLINSGVTTFNADFTAGNGMENNVAFTIPFGRTVTLGGAGLNNQSTFTLAGGTLATTTITNSGNFVLDSGTLTFTQAGATIANPIVSNTPNTTININANSISLGSASSFTGFSHQGTLNVGANTVTLNSAGYARLGLLTTLAGGTVNAPNGFYLPGGGNLVGNGAVNASVAADLGSVIEVDGALALGDAASPAGFFSSGELRTRQFAVTLNSSGAATLGNLTTLGSGSNAGTLNAINGLVVDFGRSITGFGTINSANTLVRRTIINGVAQGSSMSQPLTFTGYVKGVGSFDNVTFAGTYDPGLSPTLATVGSISFSPTNTLVMELGGTDRGDEYDAILASGTLGLGGTMQVTLIGGFNPAAGNAFDLYDSAALAGTFATVSLPALTGGLTWDSSQLYTTGVLIVAAPILPGDYNDDGSVDAADYVVWRKNEGTTNTLPNDPIGGTIGSAQFDQWRANFGDTLGSGSSSGSAPETAVPEPAAVLLMAFGLLLPVLGRSERLRSRTT